MKVEMDLPGDQKTAPILALVDTGSECSLISDRLCDLYNLSYEQGQGNLQVVGGSCAVKGVIPCTFNVANYKFKSVNCNVFSQVGA